MSCDGVLEGIAVAAAIILAFVVVIGVATNILTGAEVIAKWLQRRGGGG